jgi:hypothetical protein
MKINAVLYRLGKQDHPHRCLSFLLAFERIQKLVGFYNKKTVVF